mmetsp:Transcript_70568/g.125628  ORF Transcript_70568/g.125628 Transcript_70568/m.125628 type:complete len:80 (-) Transcript_70568:9-248(-)
MVACADSAAKSVSTKDTDEGFCKERSDLDARARIRPRSSIARVQALAGDTLPPVESSGSRDRDRQVIGVPEIQHPGPCL